MKEDILYYGVLAIMLLMFFAMVDKHNDKDKYCFDYPLTKEQVIEKTIACSERNRTPVMIYDNEMNVWAVKCIKK